MEVIGGNTLGLDRATSALDHVDARLGPAYQITKIGGVALGGAPISFGSSVVSSALTMGFGTSNPKASQVIGHAGLAADGLFRGLLYSGGLLHGVAARKMPWLVVSRSAPDGLAGLASGISRVGNFARMSLLGIGGVLGALRAAKAVSSANGDTRALYMTRDGRGGTLQAVGSALLMIKHPATYLAGAGVFVAVVVNDLL